MLGVLAVIKLLIKHPAVLLLQQRCCVNQENPGSEPTTIQQVRHDLMPVDRLLWLVGVALPGVVAQVNRS